MRPINEIIIHCSATRPDWWSGRKTSQKVAEVRRWHIEDRGWRDIGYHFLIDRDGTIATGRPLDQIGAHVEGRNTGTIGICLFGGHGSAATDQFEQNFTPEQDAALRKLIAQLEAQFGSLKISGHNQYAPKACPGFKVAAWFYRKVGKPAVAAAPPPPVVTEDPAEQPPTGGFFNFIATWFAGLKWR